MQLLDKKEQIIQQNSLFSSLKESEFEWVKEEIIPKLETVNYSLGDDIIWAGDRGDNFYIIATGKARKLDRSSGKNITLAVLNKGDSFGDRCLLSLDPSPYTVRASEDLTLLKLERIEFDRLVEKFPILKSKLKSSLQQQQEFQFFRTLNIFSNLKLSEAYKYQQDIKEIKLQAGEYFFEEGRSADAAYIVRSGQVRLIKEDTTLAIVREREICGETALLSSEDIYPISAIATKDTVVLCLPKYPFSQLKNNSKIEQYLTKISRNRQLQSRAILERGEHSDYQNNQEKKIYFKTVKLDKKNLSSNYTLAATDEQILAGMACLATINRHWKQETDLQPIIEKKLRQNSSEDIISLSRIAESLGYLTCLLHLNE